MRTPICDFVQSYVDQKPLRLHMPGHKGAGIPENRDITEIGGADVLYHTRGIIRESEAFAASLFGSGRTFYSVEGASLCIRAMLFLARLHAEEKQRPPLILAGRNAHRSFWTAAALLDLQVEGMPGESLLTCRPSAGEVARKLDKMKEYPAAVFLTSPDYLGCRADVEAIAAVCHTREIPLLVDNAHGAYLKFVPDAKHPLEAGADLVCDSAHKTLPVLTGGAYLHVGTKAPALFSGQGERALEMFASTSPSWLILQSLDHCNLLLANQLPEKLGEMARETEALKKRLAETGYKVAGIGEAMECSDPLKVTLFPKTYGYTGNMLHEMLRKSRIECEFSDPDSLVMMVSPGTGKEGIKRLEAVLCEVPRQERIREEPPDPPVPERIFSLREAMTGLAEEVPAKKSLGRILADACVSCPPAVSILTGGEKVDDSALRCFCYYGIEKVSCVPEKKILHKP